ncbi:hypothetical protein AB1N83_005137 [Pleurotus pulmonarius]
MKKNEHSLALWEAAESSSIQYSTLTFNFGFSDSAAASVTGVLLNRLRGMRQSVREAEGWYICADAFGMRMWEACKRQKYESAGAQHVQRGHERGLVLRANIRTLLRCMWEVRRMQDPRGRKMAWVRTRVRGNVDYRLHVARYALKLKAWVVENVQLALPAETTLYTCSDSLVVTYTYTYTYIYVYV